MVEKPEERPARSMLAWRRETVMSFRKTLLDGSRPMVTCSSVSSNTEPVWGPLTMESVGLDGFWASIRLGEVESVGGMRNISVAPIWDASLLVGCMSDCSLSRG